VEDELGRKEGGKEGGWGGDCCKSLALFWLY
jgi:hypothetical protein